MHTKHDRISVPIIISLLCAIVVGYVSANNTFAQLTTNNFQIPTKIHGVKILSPINNQNITLSEISNLTISGTSRDNATSNCRVSIVVNGIRPYQQTIATGNAGANDYSTWTFHLSPPYNNIKEGINKITAKFSCDDNPSVVSYYSVNTIIGMPGAASLLNENAFHAAQNSSSSNNNNVTNTDSRQLSASISVAKNPIVRGNTQTIVITISDPHSLQGIKAARVDTSVRYSSGFTKEFFDVSNQSGRISYSLPIPQNSAGGIFKITTKASASGYEPVSLSRTFTVLSSVNNDKGRIYNPSAVASNTTNIRTDRNNPLSSTVSPHPEGTPISGTFSVTVNGIAVVPVESNNSNVSQTLSLPPPPAPSSTSNTCNDNIPITKVTANGEGGGGTVASNVVDKNLSTRWANKGLGSWIQLDIGSESPICSIDIAWYKGNSRSYNFEISSSNDGSAFDKIYSGKSSGKSLAPEKYEFGNPVSARFLRITVNGNTASDKDQNTWAAITEINVTGNTINSSTLTNGPPSSSLPLLLPTTEPPATATNATSPTLTSFSTILKISGIYNQNSLTADSLKMAPSKVEGNLTIIDTTSGKEVDKFDVAPANIALSQLSKKLTITTSLDDPLSQGNVTAILKFPSPINLKNKGTYNSLITNENMLIARIDGKTYNSAGTATGEVVVRIP
jgi:hypothetical protein